MAVFGGTTAGTVFSMSTQWRALLGLIVVCGLPSLFRRAKHHVRSDLPVLPMWARAADVLTLLLALVAVYVTVFGGITIGSVFSMSTPWRALLGLTVIGGLRHYLIRTSPFHALAVGCGRRCLSAYERATHIGLSVVGGLRHSLIRASSPLRERVWNCGRRCLSAYERATHMTVGRALQLFALTALAVAQPLFDVVSREPTFLVARNTTSYQLGVFVVIIGVALPLALVAIEAISTRLHVVAGNVVHMLLVTVLGSALLLPLLKRAGNMDTIPLLAVSVALATGIAVGLQRSSVIQMFLKALSPAVVIVPVVFLANPDIRGAVVGTDLAPVPAQVEHGPPIVIVVFDELPTSSLMNGEREIDRIRYPNFARLADEATWFRNASTVSSQTVWAVPAIITGKYPIEPHAVPTRRYYPNNLFTMLSESYQIALFGRFLQLCPTNTCTYDFEVHDTLWDLTADLTVVFFHVIAPDSLASHLPPIVGDWRGFARQRRFREVDGKLHRDDRSSEYNRFLQTITSDRSGQLYFLHTLMPHMPFQYVPSGTLYRAPDYQQRREGGEHLFLKSDPWLPLVLQQRQLLQVGFADRLIGDLVGRLQAQGIYDESLIIITADHGASFQHSKRRRGEPDEGKEADILSVPLIVKLPQQVTGAVSDRNVETVDIVPTIADVLSTTVPYEVDGRSLLDTSEPERPEKTFVRRSLERVRVVNYPRQFENPSLEQKLQHFHSSLYGLGPHASLVGRPVSTLDVPPGTPSLVKLRNASRFKNVDVEAETLPLYVRGTFTTPPTERVSLAIGLNGTIVATTVSYREQGEWVFASMVPEEALVSGANDLQVFVLNEVNDDAVLGSARMQENGAPNTTVVPN